jgi:zinc/manganese transport system permease protein
VGLSVLIGALVTWFGLGWAFFADQGTGFTITTLAFGCYVLALLVRAVLRRPRRTYPVAPGVLEGVS